MPCVVVVGAQWGDEGKGKVIDLLTEKAQMVVRFAGGPNAGHTLVTGTERIVVRLIPSGVLRRKKCVLAQGMVIDPRTLVDEIRELEARGYLRDNELVVSDRAHAILPVHVLIDTLREGSSAAIGTTKRGVGPCYEDKMARRGIPLGAMRDAKSFEQSVERLVEAWTPTAKAFGATLPSASAMIAELAPARERILPLLVNTSLLVDGAVRAKKNVLFEGAQGTLLDIDHGTYPFVTSSTATAGGACTGAGVGPTRIDQVVGLVKAYTTRVGGGPFPTELTDAVGERLRAVGAEFGSVTGRARRCGWLDFPALRYAARINGLSSLAVTKLDVLTGLDELRVCVAYDTPQGRVTELPIDDLPRAMPVYETLPGWREPIGAARTLEALPRTARAYLDLIAREVDVPIGIVSVGSARDETIVLQHPFG
jgi:adenylosuccinate synthase